MKAMTMNKPSHVTLWTTDEMRLVMILLKINTLKEVVEITGFSENKIVRKAQSKGWKVTR